MDTEDTGVPGTLVSNRYPPRYPTCPCGYPVGVICRCKGLDGGIAQLALARKFWYTQPGRANAACRCWHGRSWYRTNFDFLGIQLTCQEGKVHLPAIWQVKQPKFQNFTCLLAFVQPPAFSGPVPNSGRRVDDRCCVCGTSWLVNAFVFRSRSVCWSVWWLGRLLFT